MTWQILFHPLVLKEDFPKIDKTAQSSILKAIRRKLALDPFAYGKALAGELKGYWRLRVGDFRVIYRVEKNKVEVYVIKVGIRRDYKVYEELFNRLRKM